MLENINTDIYCLILAFRILIGIEIERLSLHKITENSSKPFTHTV